jgi:hypothetical protein
MNGISKTGIAAIVSVVCLGAASITGHAISEEMQVNIADVVYTTIGVGFAVAGIIRNFKKKG